MRRLDQILAVPGLDGVVIGPHDLSLSLGVPEQYSDPRFDAAVEEIVSKVREKGLGVGIHFPYDPNLQVKWARKGLNIILHSADIFLFQQGLQRDITTIRQVMGDERG
jgi:2-keto-3-deoxy-L-rhamnonate aldolase RhmA